MIDWINEGMNSNTRVVIKNNSKLAYEILLQNYNYNYVMENMKK